MNTFDTFAQRYLREWDKRATVRTQQRWRLPAEIDLGRLFPFEFQPIARHAAVVALGEKAVHEMLVRTLFKFQAEVAHLEMAVVGELCGKLANGAFGFPLPASVRQVARTIGVDEFYHSYLAREFIADLSQHTGIDPGPLPDGTYPLATALAAVRRDADPAILGEAEIMVLCFAENFVTEELFGLVKNTPKDTAFHIALREHLVDEGRHQIFFQMLMRHIWQEIDEPTRTALGALLPGFLDAFILDREFVAELRHGPSRPARLRRDAQSRDRARVLRRCIWRAANPQERHVRDPETFQSGEGRAHRRAWTDPRGLGPLGLDRRSDAARPGQRRLAAAERPCHKTSAFRGWEAI